MLFGQLQQIGLTLSSFCLNNTIRQPILCTVNIILIKFITYINLNTIKIIKYNFFIKVNR